MFGRHKRTFSTNTDTTWLPWSFFCLSFNRWWAKASNQSIWYLLYCIRCCCFLHKSLILIVSLSTRAKNPSKFLWKYLFVFFLRILWLLQKLELPKEQKYFAQDSVRFSLSKMVIWLFLSSFFWLPMQPRTKHFLNDLSRVIVMQYSKQIKCLCQHFVIRKKSARYDYFPSLHKGPTT